jgi:hypothetical protein
MRGPLRSLLAILVGAGVGLPQVGCSQAEDAAFEVELAAAQHMLDRSRIDSVRLDPAFARPGTAPGERTSVLRPHARTEQLLETLKALRSESPTSGAVFLSMSNPRIAGDTATISVTVTHPAGPDRAMLMYETLALTLRARRGVWNVVHEVQLGIS